MSEKVQSIIEAARDLDPDQRRELIAVLAAIDVSRTGVADSRRQTVDSVRGKYRHVATSSESFMSRKQGDTALESRP
jgi:hypothetical protein